MACTVLLFICLDFIPTHLVQRKLRWFGFAARRPYKDLVPDLLFPNGLGERFRRGHTWPSCLDWLRDWRQRLATYSWNIIIPAGDADAACPGWMPPKVQMVMLSTRLGKNCRIQAGFVENRIESKSAQGRQMTSVADEITSGIHSKFYWHYLKRPDRY